MADKLSELERSNFDLKMRIYYLNNKLAEAEQGGYLEDSAEKVVNLLQQRDSTAEKLKGENAAANRRISELETELNLVKTKLESNMKSKDVSMTKARDSSVLQMEENLKRERQAALAVAQHDSSVIIQLEAEIKKLNGRHDSDLLLISEASEKCAKLMATIGEKERDVERKAESLVAVKNQNETLQEKIKSQDLLINELNNRLQSSFEQRRLENGTNKPTYQPNSSVGGMSSPGRLMPPPVGTMGAGASHTTPATSRFSSSVNLAPREAQGPMGSTVGDATHASPKPAPKLGAPHMSTPSGSEQHHTPQTSGARPPNTDAGKHEDVHGSGGAEMHSYHRSLRDKYFQSQSSIGINPPDLHQPSPGGQSADAVRTELLALRSENESFKKQLETERSAMQNLQGVLDNVRTAAEEITLLEAEEIARLESEVEKLSKEKSSFMQTVKKNNDTIEQLRVKVFQLEADLNDIYGKQSQGVYRKSNGSSPSKEHNYGRNPRRERYGNVKNSSAGGGGISRMNSFGSDDMNALQPDGGASLAYGGHGDKFVSSPKKLIKATEQQPQQQAVIEMYRQREAELLEALEAVILRCQELEKESS